MGGCSTHLGDCLPSALKATKQTLIPVCASPLSRSREKTALSHALHSGARLSLKRTTSLLLESVQPTLVGTKGGLRRKSAGLGAQCTMNIRLSGLKRSVCIVHVDVGVEVLST